MHHNPEDVKYTYNNEWARMESENIVVVGITDQAQEVLGSVLSVVLPDVDENVGVGDDLGTIESTKTVSELMSPFSGTIVEVNELLLDAPTLINSDPYDDGWLYKIQLVDKSEYDELIELDEYLEILEANEE